MSDCPIAVFRVDCCNLVHAVTKCHKNFRAPLERPSWDRDLSAYNKWLR